VNENSNVFATTTVSPFRNARLDQAFKVINQMMADGVIESYALGGATGAFFYIEPDTTYDVDVFCVISGMEANALVMLEPIYDYLRAKGYKPDAEMVIIEGIPVQFLPVFNSLNEEAVQNAAELDYLGVPVRVMSPEHLMAIMLQTGRPKDYVRVARFLETDTFDRDTLRQMLERHDLAKAWGNVRLLERRLTK
jgi:hypothetical protein